MTAPLRPRRAAAAGPTPSKPGRFDMAAHRKAFGEYWGAVGRDIGRAIREGRA